MLWRVKEVVLEGGKLIHTYRTLSEETRHFFNGDLKMEADEKMVLAGILHWDKEGMHATFKCPHADGGRKKNIF